jgi:hypothetical protein
MKVNRKVTELMTELRNIALGLVKGDIVCDWTSNDHPVSTVSEVQQLIFSLRDIGMMYGNRKEAVDHDKFGNPVFTAFRTLTIDEALHVAEMVYRYLGILYAYKEVEIPSERHNPYQLPAAKASGL